MSKYKIADAKSWGDPLKDRKETRSLYLTREDWEYLIEEGDSKPSVAVRAMIEAKRNQSSAKRDSDDLRITENNSTT